ncbi:hypothetical protein E2C01_096436 [Portunus trituberculatus]|uniref:Uncharacterized protein n=1 Tax=Portunus trituberculatus TaxID=210409 RepID=A0A5B7K1R2_PORTR|nr:hypothetical protein [Portunus trituberculatus]
MTSLPPNTQYRLSARVAVMFLGYTLVTMGKRISLMMGLHKAGLQTREIMVNVGVSEGSMRNWVKRFKNNGGLELPSAEPKPSP